MDEESVFLEQQVGGDEMRTPLGRQRRNPRILNLRADVVEAGGKDGLRLGTFKTG